MGNEVFPTSEQEASQTPLLDMYAREVITFRGVTAPMDVLIGLCPIPKDQMDPQKIEQWTANILTESGVEIPKDLLPADPAEDAKKKLN